VISTADRLLRRLRLRHVELLDLLGTLSNMRVAAERMNLSQPAVSKMLREVESAYGTTLFLRSKAGVQPTPAGVVAIRQARVIRNEIEVTGIAVDAAIAGRGSLLRVGTFAAVSVVPSAILRLRKSLPQAEVHLREGPPAALIELLLRNEIDCAVTALPSTTVGDEVLGRLRLRAFADDRLCIIASNKHALAGRRRIAWSELEKCPWVLPPQEAMLRQAFVGACLQNQLPPPAPAIETLSPLTLQRLVRSDRALLGVTRVEQLRAELSVAELVDLPVLPRVPLPPMSLVTRRTQGLEAPLIEPFYQALRKAAR
jgi:DNA-binding transcriptional LysR family regulator